MTELNTNRNQFQKGTVVYFVDFLGGVGKINKYTVGYGIIEENYVNETCIQLLELRNNRFIEGILEKEFVTPTKWRKLPKDWSWDYRLLKVETEKLPEFDITNPNSILEAYNNGVLVRKQDNDDCVFHTEVSKDKGWRIVREYDRWDMQYRHSCYISLPYSKVYLTFDEAQEKVNEMYAEFQRQASLSDYDWSVEQIDKELGKYNKMTGCDISEYRKELLSKPNVKEICVRICGKELQWKYDKNKKWMGFGA